MKRLILLSALFLLSCEKENVTPNPFEGDDCKCGIITDVVFYAQPNNAHYKFKVRNNCSNNNTYVNLSSWINSGGSTDVGDYVCADNEW